MKKTALLSTFLVVAIAAGVSFAAPQQSSTTPSLGELARKLRAERTKKGTKKPAKVFTNDNIPKSGGMMMANSSNESAEGGNTATGGSFTETKTPEGVHDEKYYQDRMAELRSQKEMHQRELSVLEQKLSQNQMQFYSDPQKQLDQESNPGSYREDIKKKQADINKKKQQIAADDQAITNLEQQCHREGCPAGWLR